MRSRTEEEEGEQNSSGGRGAEQKSRRGEE
jgi:hypothetical protein